VGPPGFEPGTKGL